MSDTLVAYCERLQAGGETWNVLSNLAFVACGVATLRWRLALRGPRGPGADAGERWLSALALLPFAIAAGSALYHARPSAVTQALDVGPIALYVVIAVALALRRVLTLSRGRCTFALATWLLASAACARFPEVLAGSLLYAPTLATLLVLTGAAAPPHRERLAATSVAFAAALTARAADLPLCPVLPLGTHVLWHVLAATAAWFAFSVVARTGPAASRTGHDHAR